MPLAIVIGFVIYLFVVANFISFQTLLGNRRENAEKNVDDRCYSIVVSVFAIWLNMLTGDLNLELLMFVFYIEK